MVAKWRLNSSSILFSAATHPVHLYLRCPPAVWLTSSPAHLQTWNQPTRRLGGENFPHVMENNLRRKSKSKTSTQHPKRLALTLPRGTHSPLLQFPGERTVRNKRLKLHESVLHKRYSMILTELTTICMAKMWCIVRSGQEHNKKMKHKNKSVSCRNVPPRPSPTAPSQYHAQRLFSHAILQPHQTSIRIAFCSQPPPWILSRHNQITAVVCVTRAVAFVSNSSPKKPLPRVRVNATRKAPDHHSAKVERTRPKTAKRAGGGILTPAANTHAHTHTHRWHRHIQHSQPMTQPPPSTTVPVISGHTPPLKRSANHNVQHLGLLPSRTVFFVDVHTIHRPPRSPAQTKTLTP